MYKHLLVAIDGSELAQNALEQAIALAKAAGRQSDDRDCDGALACFNSR